MLHHNLTKTDRLLLRPLEAAATLGVSLRTLMSWTAAGTIPHFRQGRCLRYSTDSLRDWITARQASQSLAQQEPAKWDGQG